VQQKTNNRYQTWKTTNKKTWNKIQKLCVSAYPSDPN